MDAITQWSTQNLVLCVLGTWVTHDTKHIYLYGNHIKVNEVGDAIQTTLDFLDFLLKIEDYYASLPIIGLFGSKYIL